MPLPRLLLAAAVVVCSHSLASAQGSLTPPPGPTGPVFKTLTQIEPRTDVATLAGDTNAMHVITQPGSYYLTGNVTITGPRAGIAIAASDVTLDLHGFTIAGNPGATAGVDFRGTLSGCRVFKGHIQGLGIGVRSSGIGNRMSQAAFQDLAIRSCTKGFDLDPINDVRVERARVSTTTHGGIDLNGRGTVVNSQVDSIAGTGVVNGINADVVTDCQVSSITGSTAVGIDAAQVINCRAREIGNASTGNSTGIIGSGFALGRGLPKQPAGKSPPRFVRPSRTGLQPVA